MKLFEMDGFLRGKCLPGDMKVNETNAEYLVRKFAEAESKCSALAAENAGMKQIIDSVTDLNNEPQYHAEGMGCGLEDRGITDRYDACRYGWDEAMERIYGEVIPCAEEIAFPATDASLAEVRAQGVEAFASVLEARGKHHEYVEIANAYAALLRKGVQS